MPRIVRHSLWLTLLSLYCSEAWAGSNAAAEALFVQGQNAMKAGDYDKACKQFRESDRLEAATGTQLNLANCEEKRGRIATAWALYKSVVGSLDDSDKRRAFAQDKVKVLEPRVPRLTLILGEGTPEDVTVRIAGMDLSAASFNIALPIDPGQHTAKASTPGGSTKTFSVTIKEGESKKVMFSIAAAAPAAAAPTVAPAPAATPSATTPPGDAATTAPSAPPPAGLGQDVGASGSSGTTTIAYVLTGAGGAVFLGGAVVGALVLNEYKKHRNGCWDPNSEYPQGGCYPEGVEAREDGERLAPFATIGMIAGAAIAGAGVTMLLLAPGAESGQVALSAQARYQGASLSVYGHF